MVYKKILGNIPSLSSLLLAGMVLGGCEKSKDNSNQGDNKRSEDSGRAPVFDTQQLSEDEKEAMWKMHYNIFNKKCLELEHLGKPDLQLRDGAAYEEEAKATSLKEALHRRAKEIYLEGERFPGKAGESMKVLSKSEFSKNKEQWGQFLERIARVWQRYHEIYAELYAVYESILNGKERSINQQWTPILESIKQFYDSEVKDYFSPNFAFTGKGAKGPTLPQSTNQGLVDFLEDEQSLNGVKDIMDESIKKLMVKIAQKNVQKEEEEVINKRGSQIDAKTNKEKSFHVDRIDNECTSSINPGEGISLIDVNFKQLFFNLFRGHWNESKKKVMEGIFAVTKGEKLKANSDSFQGLVEQAKNIPEQFATYLANLIEGSDLKDFFVVADLDQIFSEFSSFLKSAAGAPNEGGTYAFHSDPDQESGSASSPKILVTEGSGTGAFFNKLLTECDRNFTPGPDGLFKDIEDLSKRDTTTQSYNLRQLLCIRIASEITKKKDYQDVFLSTKGKTLQEAVNSFKALLMTDSISDGIIVKKINQKYMLTSLGHTLKKHILDINHRLANRQGLDKDILTYSDMQKNLPDGSQFKIEDIGEWSKTVYENLTYFLQLPEKLIKVLKKEDEKIDYEQMLESGQIGLNLNIAELDRIRKAYRDKINPQPKPTSASNKGEDEDNDEDKENNPNNEE